MYEQFRFGDFSETSDDGSNLLFQGGGKDDAFSRTGFSTLPESNPFSLEVRNYPTSPSPVVGKYRYGS